MSDEMRRPGAKLPPTAATALLTLRLRSALQEAEAAEAEEAAFDAVAQRHAAKAELDRLFEQRRAALSAELDEARDAAARRVHAARTEADELRAEAATRAQAVRATVSAPAAAPTSDDIWAPVPVTSQTLADAEQQVDPWSRFSLPEPASPSEIESAVEAAVAQSIVVDRWADVPATRAADQSPAVVTVDAEAFARVFATVLATVLDERFAAWRSGMVGPLAPQALVEATPERKPSLMRRAFHVDAVLSAVAAAIVLVLLFAWLG